MLPTSAPIPIAAPLSAAPILLPAPLPTAAPLPAPMPTSTSLPSPVLPAAAPLPAPMPLPLPGTAPIPPLIIPPPPGCSSRPIPNAPKVQLPYALPEPEPKYRINDQDDVEKFLSQSFHSQKIDPQNSKYISSSSYEYLYKYEGGRRRKNQTVTKYGIPYIKQYHTPNTLLSDTETKSFMKNISTEQPVVPLTASIPTTAPLSASIPNTAPLPAPFPATAPLSASILTTAPLPAPIPTTAPLPAPIPTTAPLPISIPLGAPIPNGNTVSIQNMTSMQHAFVIENDKAKYDPIKIYYFELCERTMDDADDEYKMQNEGDYDSYDEFDVYDVLKLNDKNKKHMLITGLLSSDIGYVLNKEIKKTLEKTENDYRYPLRNRQIILEIMSARSTLTKTAYRMFLRISKGGIMDVDSLIADEQAELKKVCVIDDHLNTFEKWKIRIHDLVDPSLMSCYYNIHQKEEKTVNDNVVDLQDDKMKAFRNDLVKSMDNLKEISSNKYWIPTVFQRIQNGNIEILSDINNLSRIKYPKLYTIIAAVFKKMLPSFEYICGYDFDKENINEFNVIVKMQNYEIYPGAEVYQSQLHREGFEEEHIVAVGIYYYYKSGSIGDDVFTLNHEFEIDKYEKTNIYQDIDVKHNSFVVFNNRLGYLHYLKKLKSFTFRYVTKRKILVLALVDPRKTKYKSNIYHRQIKNTMDIVVNLEDKLYLIVLNWSRGCNVKQNISDDLMCLIQLFTMNDSSVNILMRNVSKMNEFIKDAENEYKNRPRQRKKD